MTICSSSKCRGKRVLPRQNGTCPWCDANLRRAIPQVDPDLRQALIANLILHIETGKTPA